MKPEKVGLACAGGGIEGAVYEIGVLAALEEAIPGLSFNTMDVYVGVSAGALITSSLANGLTPRQLSHAILSRSEGVHPISPEIFYKPALSEFWERFKKAPGILLSSLAKYMDNQSDTSILGVFAGLTHVLPVGLFDNEPIEEYLVENFKLEGRTNDFRKLKSKLRIIATDLDSGKTIRFGDETTEHIPISKAVQASTALPAVYLPVEIEGRYYVDGVARRTVHASVALDEGAKLLFCVNPIVPLDSTVTKEMIENGESLRSKGLPTVLSQTFRTMIYSRMKVGLEKYNTTHPNSDLILFEPRPDDYRMFFNNIFSFSTRKEVCDHAYKTTRADLIARKDQIIPVLEKYGYTLDFEELKDLNKSLYEDPPLKSGKEALRKLDELLNRLDTLVAS